MDDSWAISLIVIAFILGAVAGWKLHLWVVRSLKKERDYYTEKAVVWYPAPSVQAHARIRIAACACGKEGSGEMVYPSAGPGM